MKKRFAVGILFALIACSVFSQSLIQAAMRDDYKEFSALINGGADLSETTETGLTVQYALAYFSAKNFKKACALLSKKGVDLDAAPHNNLSLLHLLAYACDAEKLQELLKYKGDVNRTISTTGLTPINMTQFATYKFVSNQQISADAKKKTEKCRAILEKAGSEPFSYVPLSMGNVGNFFFCLYNIVSSVYPFVTPQMLNAADLFEMTEIDGQPMATVRYDMIAPLFLYVALETEVNSYTDTREFLEKLKTSATSPDPYFVIAQMGVNPLAPYQWVGVICDETVTEDTLVQVSNPDANFTFVPFQPKDITQLILVRITGALSDE